MCLTPFTLVADYLLQRLIGSSVSSSGVFWILGLFSIVTGPGFSQAQRDLRAPGSLVRKRNFSGICRNRKE